MQNNSWIIFACIYAAFQTIAEAFLLPCSRQTSTWQRRKKSSLSLFRELVSNDDEDLRPNISVIAKQDGFDNFLQADDRLCVIKVYAPFCKTCKAFGPRFRKLALQRGDGINAAGEVSNPGLARFGEIEYSSNIKLCKSLKINKFPTVLIYRGGGDIERIGEIDCSKNISIEYLVSEMDQVLGAVNK